MPAIPASPLLRGATQAASARPHGKRVEDQRDGAFADVLARLEVAQAPAEARPAALPGQAPVRSAKAGTAASPAPAVASAPDQLRRGVAFEGSAKAAAAPQGLAPPAAAAASPAPAPPPAPAGFDATLLPHALRAPGSAPASTTRATAAPSRPAAREAAAEASAAPAAPLKEALRLGTGRALRPTPAAPAEEAREAPSRKPPARAQPAHDFALPTPAQGPMAPGASGAPAAAQVEARPPARALPPSAGGLASLPHQLAEAAAAEASLRLTVLPHAANLRVSAPEGGDLSVHLRVRDGVANLTVAGAGSEAAMARSADLRAALAGQGISLGRIDRVAAGAAASPADAAGPRSRSRSGSNGAERRDSTDRHGGSAAEAAAETGLARGLH